MRIAQFVVQTFSFYQKNIYGVFLLFFIFWSHSVREQDVRVNNINYLKLLNENHLSGSVIFLKLIKVIKYNYYIIDLYISRALYILIKEETRCYASGIPTAI